MARVAFLGLGAMGERMAKNLIAAGHELIVWNRSADRCAPFVDMGAVQAETPKAAAKGAQFIIAMIRDVEASRQVWCDPETGAFAGMSSDAVAIESSTITPGWAEELGTIAEGENLHFLEAPVSGTLPQAEQATLVYFVGGNADVLARTQDVLAAMGQPIHHVGAFGMGARMKLATNAMLGIQAAAWGEIVPMLERGGLDMTLALKALASTPVWAPNANYVTGTMVRRDFSPKFPVDLIAKDFRYAVAEGGLARMPMTEAARVMFARASDAGHGEDNMTSVVEVNRK